MSPALLSKRLKELEDAGVLEHVLIRKTPETYEYHLTDAGRELGPVIEAIGIWGHRWVESEPSLDNLDVQLLMWDMRRNLDVTPLPSRKLNIQFIYPELDTARRDFWLLVDPKEGADLCSIDPGFDVDLYVRTDLRTMTAIWMGLDSVQQARKDDRLELIGDNAVAKSMQTWLGLSPFAVQEKQVN